MNYPTGTGQLQNKTAVVTGGSRGIGRAIVLVPGDGAVGPGSRAADHARGAGGGARGTTTAQAADGGNRDGWRLPVRA